MVRKKYSGCKNYPCAGVCSFTYILFLFQFYLSRLNTFLGSAMFLRMTLLLLCALQWSNSLHGNFGETNQSELAAFTSYALAFPTNFLALVDTYDVSEHFLFYLARSC